MTDADHFHDAFWSALRTRRTGLLAVRNGTAEHVAPMTAHFDEPGPVFFYAPAGGVLATHIAQPHTGHWFFSDPEHHVFASADADLSIETDPALRSRFWSEETEAWFPGGPEQDAVVLLRCELGGAQVWLGSHPQGKQGQTRDLRAHIEL